MEGFWTTATRKLKNRKKKNHYKGHTQVNPCRKEYTFNSQRSITKKKEKWNIDWSKMFVQIKKTKNTQHKKKNQNQNNKKPQTSSLTVLGVISHL